VRKDQNRSQMWGMGGLSRSHEVEVAGWATLNAISKQQLGPAKKKSVTPVVGGWVRVRKRTRVRFIFSIFF
jgi:hypothetical protein